MALVIASPRGIKGTGHLYVNMPDLIRAVVKTVGSLSPALPR